MLTDKVSNADIKKVLTQLQVYIDSNENTKDFLMLLALLIHLY